MVSEHLEFAVMHHCQTLGHFFLQEGRVPRGAQRSIPDPLHGERLLCYRPFTTTLWQQDLLRKERPLHFLMFRQIGSFQIAAPDSAVPHHCQTLGHFFLQEGRVPRGAQRSIPDPLHGERLLCYRPFATILRKEKPLNVLKFDSQKAIFRNSSAGFSCAAPLSNTWPLLLARRPSAAWCTEKYSRSTPR